MKRYRNTAFKTVKKIRLLDDLGIKVTIEQEARLRKAKTENELDRVAVDIINQSSLYSTC